ncbi:MAG: HDOD domain-containing protein [Spirochaetales bacterium]|nr:HDOD domain-containing protein [Spirochaetales bacterium]
MEIERDFARLTEKFKNQKKVEIPYPGAESDESLFIHGLIIKGLTYTGPLFLGRFLALAVHEILLSLDTMKLWRAFLVGEKISPEGATAEHRLSFEKARERELLALRKAAADQKISIVFEARLQSDLVEYTITTNFLFTKEEIAGLEQNLVTTSSELGKSDLAELSGLTLAGKALHMAGVHPQLLSESTSSLRLGVGSRNQSHAPIERARPYIDEIEHLPDFPDNIRRIMEACNDEKSDARTIAHEISQDAPIASAIIRLANSGGFAGGHISDLLEAVKIVGIRNISGLLLNVGAIGILEKKFGITEELHLHPIRVAAYSRFLARKFKFARIADAAYVAGLLHDIGRVVLAARMTEKEAFEKASTIEPAYRLSIEEMTCGINHSELGAMLARKWNFPEHLSAAIEFHHAPYLALAEHRDLVFTVYLANAIADYEQGKVNFYTLEPEVLQVFSINSRQAFEMLAALLQNQAL